MMKFMLSAVVALSIAAPAYASSGSTSTAPGAAQATVIAPIVLTHTTGATLSFGSFTTGTTGGTVAVTNGGVGSTTGDVNFIPSSAETADQFTVRGDVNRSFVIATGTGTVANGATTIAFTTTAPATGLTGTAGTASFSVGGVLTLLGSEVAGGYTGTYNATVTYN